MTKARKKPYAPPTSWDRGTGTRAQKFGLIIEDAGEIDPKTGKRVNPNNVKRARRIDVLEMYGKRGVLSARQVEAGQKLRNAHEATQRTAPAIKAIQVDSTPKPDQFIDIQIDRMSKLVSVSSLVHSDDKEIIDCCVLGNNIPAHLKQYKGRNYPNGIVKLQDALTGLADALGL